MEGRTLLLYAALLLLLCTTAQFEGAFCGGGGGGGGRGGGGRVVEGEGSGVVGGASEEGAMSCGEPSQSKGNDGRPIVVTNVEAISDVRDTRGRGAWRFRGATAILAAAALVWC